jgi:hypothetical protein
MLSGKVRKEGAMLFYWLDWATKLLPAAAIIVAVLVARMQLRAARRATATTIAKTHYRKMLSLFQKNTDVLYRGTTPERFAKLKKETELYMRYRMLFTNMSFACQEMYFAIDTEKEKHWGNALRAFVSLFREFINCNDDATPFLQSTLHPKFMEFMRATALEYRHPTASLSASPQSN